MEIKKKEWWRIIKQVKHRSLKIRCKFGYDIILRVINNSCKK